MELSKLSLLSNEKYRNMLYVPIFFVTLQCVIYNNVYEEVRFGPSSHLCRAVETLAVVDGQRRKVFAAHDNGIVA